MQLKCYVSGQSLRLYLPPVLASGSLDVLSAQFLFFGSEWQGLRKVAHFHQGDFLYDFPLNEADAISPDMGLNLSGGSWELYLHGDTLVEGQVETRITTQVATFKVVDSGPLEGGMEPTTLKAKLEQLSQRLSQGLPRGGSSGQVLMKRSDADDDSVWTPMGLASQASFLQDSGAENLFDGNWVFGYVSGAGRFNYQDSDDSRCALIPVEPNTTYSINRSYTPELFFRLVTFQSRDLADNALYDGAILTNPNGALSKTITTGPQDRLLVVCIRSLNDNLSLQVTEGSQSSLSDSRCKGYLPAPELQVYPKEALYSRRELRNRSSLLLHKNGNELTVALPLPRDNGFLRYQYKLSTNSGINLNQWRILTVEFCDPQLRSQLVLNTVKDWEGAVKESGAADFCGGYHGDESLLSQSLFVDGIPVDLSSSTLALRAFRDIVIVNKSSINRCDTPGEQLFERQKILTWTREGLQIENRWFAKQSVTLDYAYLGMMALPTTANSLNVAQYCRNDDSYLSQPAVGTQVSGGPLEPSYKAKRLDFWGDSGFAASIIFETEDSDLSIKPTKFLRCDRSQSGSLKAYYTALRSQTVAAGDVLRGKAKLLLDYSGSL